MRKVVDRVTGEVLERAAPAGVMGALESVRQEQFLVYSVLVEFHDKLLAGTPANPELIQSWLKVRGHEDKLQETVDAVAGATNGEDAVELNRLVFKGDEVGLYIEGRQVKACLREAASNSGLFIAKKGSATRIGFKQHFQHALEVGPDRIHLYGNKELHDGETLTAPDGTLEMAGTVTGRQGPRSILTAHDYALRPRLRFQMRLPVGTLSEQDLGLMLAYAETTGLGAMRGQQHGRFKVLEVEVVKEFER